MSAWRGIHGWPGVIVSLFDHFSGTGIRPYAKLISCCVSKRGADIDI